MPKKQGLGRDVNKSIEIMDLTLDCLKNFAHMPLKRGLVSNGIKENDIYKNINKTSETAFSLINMIEDLKSQLAGLKTGGNSRFANQVVARFLEESEQ